MKTLSNSFVFRKSVLFVFILLCCQSVQVTGAKEVITLGVVPQQSAKVLAQNWIPFTRYLSQTTGLNIRFATAKDIPTFEARLAEKQYELAYINPYHFVYFSELSGYQALAKQKGKRIQGIFVVRKDSGIASLQDLDGAELAFPAPAAFAASILTRGTLVQHDIDIKPYYVSSHDSVYLNVAKGLFRAGGGVLRTFQLTPEPVRKQLKILHTTRSFTPHALAASPKLEHNKRLKILTALLTLESAAKGQEILANINMKGFEAAQNQDWDDVKALNLSELMGAEPHLPGNYSTKMSH